MARRGNWRVGGERKKLFEKSTETGHYFRLRERHTEVRMNVHGTEEQLEQYALGKLPASQTVELEEHLLVCSTCLEQVEANERWAMAVREARLADVALFASAIAHNRTANAAPISRASRPLAAIVRPVSPGREPAHPGRALMIRLSKERIETP